MRLAHRTEGRLDDAISQYQAEIKNQNASLPIQRALHFLLDLPVQISYTVFEYRLLADHEAPK
jgi:hypothetical protein